MDLKLNVLSLLKEYRLKNIENIFMCDETSVKQSIDNDKTMLFDSIKSKIENEMKDIEENRRLLYLELKKKEEVHENVDQTASNQSKTTESVSLPSLPTNSAIIPTVTSSAAGSEKRKKKLFL